MSHRCKVSSLSWLLVVVLGCGDDGGGSTGVDSTGSSGAPVGSSEAGEVVTTGGSGDESSSGDTSGDTSGGSSGDTAVDVCAGSVLTWENFGEPFALSWCTGCHHSALPTAERAGAPCGVNFDTHAGVSVFAANIHVRALDYAMLDGVTPMPPAAIVPEEELALLREWLDCGAPGPETGQAGLSCPDP